MANAFLEYLKTKIQKDTSFLEPGRAGSRIRVFDHFSPRNEELGKEATDLIRHAKKLYKNQFFLAPYTKKNVDYTHHLFMQLNKDIEENSEWHAFWTELKSQHPSLTDNDIVLLKIHFTTAYRFKIISLFSTTLQEMYPDDKLKIIAHEGHFLQTLNTLIKSDALRRYLTSDELLTAIFQDISNDLKASLGTEENFNTFYTPKNAKFIHDLGIEGFKIIFLHFNDDNCSLTHKTPAFAKTTHIRELMKSFQNAVKENNAWEENIKSDPDAVFFIQKALKTLKKDNNPDDKSLLKFFESLLLSAKANPKNLISDLKDIEKKLEGDLKNKTLETIKKIEITEGFPDVTYRVMTTLLKNLSELKVQATLANFTHPNKKVQKLIKVCDIYLGSRKTSPTPSSSAIFATSSPVYTPGAQTHTGLIAASSLPRESTLPLAPSDPKEKLVEHLQKRALEIQHPELYEQRELTRNETEISHLILESAKQISDFHDPQEIYKAITELKLSVIKVLASAAGVDKNLININEEIDALYSAYQREKQQPPKLS